MGVDPTPIPRFYLVALLLDASEALAVTMRRDWAREQALEVLAKKSNRRKFARCGE
jgi:hypothetical protein